MSDFIRERVCLYNPVLKSRPTLSDTVDFAVKYGAAGVELLSFYPEIGGASVKEVIELGFGIKRRGLVIPCFSVGANLYGADAKCDMERLKQCAEICSSLEIPYLHHTIFMAFVKEAVEGREEEIFRFGTEAALEINEYARHLGVKTIIEDQGIIFNGVYGYGRFMEIAKDRVGTVLDLGNIMFVGERAENFGRAFSDRIDHVHIKDYTVYENEPPKTDKRTYVNIKGEVLVPAEIGTGSVNFPEVAELLRDISYSGYYSMEFEDVNDEAEVRRALRFVEKTFG